ncbi:carboxypeptidase regulatory-like domain-containing protein [Candidatus Poribacteria bacterium]|nr:carboxypeptidase regulatory-like domain-containing protein [Candidatus Poribacteria bacterium]
MYTNLFAYNKSRDNSQIHCITLWWICSLFAVALTLLFSFSILHAQTTELGGIQGTVIDRKQDKPLVAQPVTLTIHRADATEIQKTMTDKSGNYRFGNLPLDPLVHYTVSTVHAGTDYTEKDVVLSTWAPNIKIDFEIGGFTEDKTQIRVKSHSFVIAPPPPDHAPDGAVTVIEAIGIENQSDLPFRTVHGTQTVGLYLTLPKGTEGFQPHQTTELAINPATNQAIRATPLPPGETHLGYTYIFHVEKDKLDLSRRLNFATAEFLFFVPEGINFAPRAKFFGAPKREQIHNNIYLIYQSTAPKAFAAGTTVDLALNVNMGSAGGALPEQTSNLGQLILIAVTAALTGGFFVAALFKLRTANNRDKSDADDTATPSDAGWLRKLSPDDYEYVRVARLEFITHLDDKYEKQEISERVYKRLRREQTERLTTLLEEQKRRTDA